MRRRAFVVVAVVAAVLAMALPAKACSCALGDPRDALARADGAFVGTLLSRRPAVAPGGEPDLQTDVFTFQVDEDVKGEYPDTFDVYSASNGAACGLEVGQGDQIGLLLYFHDDDGQWWSNLCSQMSPEDLREAAAPFPEPDGRGPAAVLVGGTWGEVGHLALDRRGRTLGYGLGDHFVVDLEVCARARRFVEVYLDRRRVTLVVRRLGSNRVLWQRDVPRDAGGGVPAEVWCEGRSGSSLLVATRSSGKDDPGHVRRVDPSGVETLYGGRLEDAAFAPGGTAYVLRGRSIVAIGGYGEGRTRQVARVPRGSRGLELPPGGNRLVTTAGAEVTVVELARGRTTKREVSGAGNADVLWWGDGRVVVMPSAGRKGRIVVLDARLRDPRRLEGRWPALENTIAGDVAWGLAYGRLYRARLSGGRAEMVRSFPSYSLYAIEGVPGKPVIDWPEPPR